MYNRNFFLIKILKNNIFGEIIIRFRRHEQAHHLSPSITLQNSAKYTMQKVSVQVYYIVLNEHFKSSQKGKFCCGNRDQ